MKPLLYILSFALLIGLGFWAYEENYQTKQIVNEAEHMQNQIAQARARLGVLKAEWAYLNRPDRLRELAELNFDPLALLPITPDQFGRMDQVEYPVVTVPEVDLNNPVDVSTLSMPEATE
ncbi:cell division protein FtsL [Pseudooceanicola onchidii]|uniref:cell division protein FtsL n=1 Tax=Pseudooceanicola onchidii TaxID=2562279 RepID=UPI0010A9C30D|nr:cell division protein FtsL [Pseudooceanicola onchidii]